MIGVAAGIVVLLLWRLTSGFDSSTAQDVEPTVPTVVAAEEVDDFSLDGGWSRVDLPGAARLRNVWEVGGTFYAAGWDSDAQATVVWTSPDGAVWRQIQVEDDRFDDAVIHDMTGFGGQVVAVGARIVGDHPVLGAVAVPEMWRSPDGESFFPLVGADIEFWIPEDAESPESFIAGGFTSVQAFGDELLVGGWEGVADPHTGVGDTRPGLWGTVNLSEFTRRGEGIALDDEAGIVRTLTTDGEFLVAGGVSVGTAHIWTSADGLSWEQAVVDAEVGSVALGATATPGGALVLGRGVVGSGEDVADVVRLWAPGPGGYNRVAAVGLDEGTLTDVSAAGLGVVAVGTVPAPGEGEAGAVWHSVDGIVWDRVQVGVLPRGSVVRSVVVGEQALVAVGVVHGQPSIWVHRLDGGEALSVGVGTLFVPPAWSAVFQQEQPSDSVPDRVLRAGAFLYGISDNRWLWQSQDGDIWTLADFDDIGLDGAERIDRIVESEIGWVAIGEGAGSRLWYSVDGERWGRPTIAPRCCTVAAFADAPGFTALVFDEAEEAWYRSTTSDGLVWEDDEAPLELPVDSVDHTATIGRLGMLWGQPKTGVENVFGSIDGEFWFPIRGPDEIFPEVVWERVWDLGGELVASGSRNDEPVLFRTTDGVEWQPLALPEFGSETLFVEDVGGFGDGLAVLVSYDDRPTRLLTFTGIGTLDEVPLDVASGFSGLWSVLVPNEEGLRMLGPDHGRVTIWQWIPSP